jgi:hypothetical protein
MRAVIANHGGRLLSPNRGQFRLDLHRRGERLVVQDFYLNQRHLHSGAEMQIVWRSNHTSDALVAKHLPGERNSLRYDRRAQRTMEFDSTDLYGIGSRRNIQFDSSYFSQRLRPYFPDDTFGGV